jgi:pimeloyl-ACP methyl ester carboxylesterase
MTAIAAAIAAALTFIIVALAMHARAYTKRVEARWPAHGRIIDADDARLHVLEAGPASAPRILLVHGASANALELWGPLSETLAQEHRVIAFDRPGMGHSTRPRRNAHTLASQARMAARVLAETGEAPVIVVGHSLGAGVALRLALDHPGRIEGLVLVAPASHPYPHKPAWWARLSSTPLIGDLFCGLLIPWLGPMLAGGSVANNFWPAPTPKTYYEEAGVGLIFRPRAFAASARDVVATNAEFAGQAPRYGDMLLPAVVITAEKDKIVSPKRHARALAADLPAAELVIAPGAGHMPHRLRTDLVIAAIRRVNALAAAPAEG